jgi:hypothetical protein
MATPRLTVPISDRDRAKLKQHLAALDTMSESALTSILLRYGINHAGDALKEAVETTDEPAG